VCVERSQWAGHVVRTFDNRILKQILEQSLGQRRHTGTAKRRRMPPICSIQKKIGMQQQDVGVNGVRKQGRSLLGNRPKSHRRRRKRRMMRRRRRRRRRKGNKKTKPKKGR